MTHRILTLNSINQNEHIHKLKMDPAHGNYADHVESILTLFMYVSVQQTVNFLRIQIKKEMYNIDGMIRTTFRPNEFGL